jgi:hypothetical protein
MDWFKQVLVGVAKDPFVVACARAVVFYAVPVATAAGVAYLNEWTDPRLVPLVPLLVAIIRAVEGEFDKANKPGQNNIDPKPVAGGGDRGLIPD